VDGAGNSGKGGIRAMPQSVSTDDCVERTCGQCHAISNVPRGARFCMFCGNRFSTVG
jgi:hypothetical protein